MLSHQHHPLTIHSVYPSILLLHSESLVRLWAPGCRRYSGFGTELDHGCTPASVYSHHSHRTKVRGVTFISVLLCVLKVLYGLVQIDVGGFKNLGGLRVLRKISVHTNVGLKYSHQHETAYTDCQTMSNTHQTKRWRLEASGHTGQSEA